MILTAAKNWSFGSFQRTGRRLWVIAICVLAWFPNLLGSPISAAKEAAIRNLASGSTIQRSAAPTSVGGHGYRFEVTNGVARVPVVVVQGTPYQMGWHLGALMREEIHAFVPRTLAGIQQQAGFSLEQLDKTWAETSAYTDDRVEQELLGMADGSNLPIRSLHQAHALPLLMPYSCSSIAAWGRATEDGHLYQTRNLDWNLAIGAHEFPVLVVYQPTEGRMHVLPTFAGFAGANCGMNDAGIVLSEMGDSPASEMPYETRAPHFTTWFRTLLYDTTRLNEVLTTFHTIPPTKRYHFVFGDGRTEHRAVKILAHAPTTEEMNIRIWKDNDSADELAPNVLPSVVYQDEGRGAFPTLKSQHGELNAPRLIELANSIPIRGGNVLNAVFDATALRLWVSYAGSGKEAYQRPYVFLDLQPLRPAP
jgi:hypothetical protein